MFVDRILACCYGNIETCKECVWIEMVSVFGIYRLFWFGNISGSDDNHLMIANEKNMEYSTVSVFVWHYLENY